MKKLFLSLVAMMIATVSFAQSSLLATLSHDGTISTYYGTTAFKEAMAKAEDVDAITLSAGQFLAANITKAITLRGAGMYTRNDSVNSHESTILQGTIEIETKDSTQNRLVIEGIYFTSWVGVNGTVKNPLFMKCRFNKFSHRDNSKLVNASFIHCRVQDSFWLPEDSYASFVNSVVYNPCNHGTKNSNIEFDNCVVAWPSSQSYTQNSISATSCATVINSYYKNCVIMVNYTNVIPSSNVCYYSLGISPYSSNYDIFNNIIGKNRTNTSVTLSQASSAFKSGALAYSDSYTYDLTDTYKKYVGTDGKEVGIYGGNLPYEEDPTTPQITKCNVAAKSTADGKLSVDIEVKAAEY